MTEPLKQCMAWLHAYFCEPARTASLPMPAFHHPLLQRDEKGIPPERGYSRVFLSMHKREIFGGTQEELPAEHGFVHQTSVVDPVERREVWRGRFLQAVSRPCRQQQSGESGGRSDEEQSYPNYNTMPQGDLQQRADRQLRRRKPYERVAFVAREAPEREVSILMQLSRGC
ncbi:PREDICTED: methylated-DNA--protein-cysteine methyltransferase isoform X3 [Pygoscelis adeliae]|nr:PREDICTED: methylated-DNA--protein-cysteine methyltransferase isoform X3 [Pygoscelis adeliae]